MSDSNRPDGRDSSRRDTFRLLPLGDSAVTVEFGNEIDPEINARVIAFAEAIRAEARVGILDVVPTYRSVTIFFDPLHWNWETLTNTLPDLSRTTPSETKPHSTLHTIPVLYGGEWGPDLEDLADFAQMPPEQAITLHASILYRVYMLGFSPGFPYMGSVPERLAMPRLATPRAKVPSGSVGIAERQTGIYPIATPGGWRLIGRTPIPLYRKTASRPFLLSPGDQVQFQPIGRDEFDRLSREMGDDQH
jgi:inhibitor of KinA